MTSSAVQLKVPDIHHGTPVTPQGALIALLMDPSRCWCTSFARPEGVDLIEMFAPRRRMYDNGAFHFWMAAMRAGQEWAQDRDWGPYFRWVEPRLYGEAFAIIPDSPGAPSQLNDALLKDWPFGNKWGVPLWHMDGPIERLGRLCEQYDRVALGWIGDPKTEPVGCAAYRDRMEVVDKLLGNRWPEIHMMRGIRVALDYPFASADASTLGQNGWRYDHWGENWQGRITYADHLERRDYASRSVRERLLRSHGPSDCATLRPSKGRRLA